MIVVNEWPHCHVAILLCHVVSNQKYNNRQLRGQSIRQEVMRDLVCI